MDHSLLCPAQAGGRGEASVRLRAFGQLSRFIVPTGTHGAHAAAARDGNRQLGRTRAAMGASSSGTRSPWRAQNVSARVFGDGDMLATTPASLTLTQVGRATSGLAPASTSTVPTAGSNHRARTERYSSSAKNRSRFALDGNVTVNTRLIRVFGPFSPRATTKSQPKAPPWRAGLRAIALRYCV